MYGIRYIIYTTDLNHETHLPSQQTLPKKIDWLPRPDEDRRRTESHQSPPQSRQENSLRVKFSKELRLRSRKEFQRVARENDRRVGRFLCVDIRPAAKMKLGISAPGRYGSSPERNRFKRLVREAFRLSHAAFPAQLEINVVPRQAAKGAHCSQVMDELIRLCKD